MDKDRKKEILAAYKEMKTIGGICAVRNTVTGKILVISAPDVKGYRNRFAFSQQTDTPVHVKLTDDWRKHGSDAFVLDILETIEKKETQTDREFADDIKVLRELWLEKLDPAQCY